MLPVGSMTDQPGKRIGRVLQLIVIFFISVLIAIFQIGTASFLSAWTSIIGSGSLAVDHPLQSMLPSLQNKSSLKVSNISPRGTETELCAKKEEWYSKPRIENIELERSLAEASIVSNPISSINNLLGQTLCHEDGTFRRSTPDFWDSSHTDMIHQWSLKLMYLAVHDFNHRPARKEYNERHFCPKGNFPSYNYECRDAKYLVSWLPGIGMGASMRLSIITYVMVAIMNDRIPLFLSNVSAGPYYLRQPSQLFSCERFDSQCIFLPTTPCVLHISELEEAPLLSGLDAFAVRQTGQVPGNYSDDRVVVIDAKIAGGKFESSPEIMNQFRRKVRDRALLLVDEWRSSLSVFDENLRSQYEFLRAAADEIGDDPALPEGAYVYSRATNRIAHAILMYLLRPNPYAKNRLETELLEVFPQSIDPATTVGLPIRGSDKCGGESTCLEFHQYMQLAREIWKNISAPLFDYSTGQSRGKLVLTTEDATVYMQRLNFTQKTGFPLDIVVNQKDPMQGSGLAKKYKDNADHIMISSLLAIRMQLHAGYIYGNCCSNFHLMIFDLAKEGCGLTKHAICLQETKDYKVCCRWRKDEGCDDIRKEYDRLHPKTVAPMTLYSERNRGRHSDAPASIP